MVESAPESSGDASPDNATAWEALPDGLRLAAGIDLDSADPTLADGKRQCVAIAATTGERCSSRALRDGLVCTAHAGRLDSSAGGRVLAERRRAARREAEERVAERKLGVRGALSAELHRRSNDVVAAVGLLLDKATAGDVKAAQALLPWLDQAFGKTIPLADKPPAQEHNLSDLSDEDLAAIVARGRAERDGTASA